MDLPGSSVFVDAEVTADFGDSVLGSMQLHQGNWGWQRAAAQAELDLEVRSSREGVGLKVLGCDGSRVLPGFRANGATSHGTRAHVACSRSLFAHYVVARFALCDFGFPGEYGHVCACVARA
jgi:hypothetical protein